jgi:hypothetical protein
MLDQNSDRPFTCPVGGVPTTWDKYRAITAAISCFKDATGADIRFLMALISRANPKTGRCDPGTRQLAIDTGVSPRHVKRCRAFWKRSDAIRYRERGRKNSVAYQINWPLLTDKFERMMKERDPNYGRNPIMVEMDGIEREAGMTGTITPHAYDRLDGICADHAAPAGNGIGGRAYRIIQTYPVDASSSALQ